MQVSSYDCFQRIDRLSYYICKLITSTVLVDVGGVGAVTVCRSFAVQPFAFSSASSNVFTFGGSGQPSAASSAPWNVQVVVILIFEYIVSECMDCDASLVCSDT